jgi:hypothetical protein
MSQKLYDHRERRFFEEAIGEEDSYREQVLLLPQARKVSGGP